MTAIATYSFDEAGLTVTDYSGNGHTWTIGDHVERVEDGHTNGGLRCVGDQVVTPLPDVGQTASRTVMFWLREDVGYPSEHFVISWDVPAITGTAWGVDLDVGPRKVRLYGRSASTLETAVATWPNDGAWHHVAGTYDQSFLRLYLDGVLMATTGLTGPLRSDADPPILFDGYTTATIDDLRIDDAALGVSSIRAAMGTPVQGNLADAATLAVTSSFIARCTAAVQRTAVTVSAESLASDPLSLETKQRLLLAQAAALDPTAYGARFAWLVASDGAITGDPSDEVLAMKVADLWSFVAGVTI